MHLSTLWEFVLKSFQNCVLRYFRPTYLGNLLTSMEKVHILHYSDVIGLPAKLQILLTLFKVQAFQHLSYPSHHIMLSGVT